MLIFAEILCRAERSSQPLETTAQELMNLLPSQTRRTTRHG
jgi:hypothetical protein